MSTPSLKDRFQGILDGLVPGADPAHLLIAVSGGLDSTALLHLLRFSPAADRFRLTVAHFDHHMRPSSQEDALWVRGVCRAWGLPLEEGAADRVLAGELAARNARYAFLRTVAERIGASYIVTAHHADDQAETVLFRILRGTGVAGLRGIPARGNGLLRPLLPFWRTEIEGYAHSHGLRWRKDPTNEAPGAARNRIRNSILPMIERMVAPGARRSLVSLAGLARENEEGWTTMVEGLIARIATADADGFELDRQRLREAGPIAGARVLRELLRRLGVVPDRAGTRSALQFITDAPSGREISLPSGVRITTEFDRAVLRRGGALPEDVAARIDRPIPGASYTVVAILGGRRYRVMVGGPPEVSGPRQAGEWATCIPSTARFPLHLRARLPGDRIRTAGGTKSLKRLMIERRIPRSERGRVPVLADDGGAILWVAGVASAIDGEVAAGDPCLEIARDD